MSVNFTELSDEEFHLCLYEANTKIINHYFQKQADMAIENARKLYLENDVNFRGFRQT